jgi:hypothetical protein
VHRFLLVSHEMTYLLKMYSNAQGAQTGIPAIAISGKNLLCLLDFVITQSFHAHVLFLIFTLTPSQIHAGPNNVFSRETFDPPLDLDTINSMLFNVIPERDIVPMVRF